jgi:hypothetical protein
MSGETLANDPKQLWQSQQREYPIMTLQEIRTKTRIVQAKIRRNLILAFAVGLLLLVMSTIAILNVGYTPARVVTAAIMAMAVAHAYTAYRRMWPLHALSPDAALQGCVEFYRRELKAQYRSAALTWRFLVPIAVFALLSWNAIFRTSALLPKVLLPSVLIAILIVRRYEVRKLRGKLTALDALETESETSD